MSSSATRSRKSIRWSSILRWSILALPLAWVFIPFYYLAIVSLIPEGVPLTGWKPPVALSLDHYRRILGSATSNIWPYLINSVFVAGVATLCSLTISIFCAYGLSRLRRSRSATTFYLSFYVLRMLPPVTMVIPYFLIYSKLGILDNRWGLVLAEVPFSLSLSVWVLKAFFDSIPMDLDEAASIDGASKWVILSRVITPLLGQGIAVTGILTFLTIYIDYMLPLTLANAHALTLPVFIAGFNTEYRFFVGDMLAATVIGMLPMIFLYIYAQKHMTRLIITGIY